MHRTYSRGAARAPATLAAIVAALLILGGCSKEPDSRKVQPNAPVQSGTDKSSGSGVGGTVDEALKERLARQDAATKMFERNVVQPAPPKAAEPPKGPEAKSPPAVAAATPAPAARSPASRQSRRGSAAFR